MHHAADREPLPVAPGEPHECRACDQRQGPFVRLGNRRHRRLAHRREAALVVLLLAFEHHGAAHRRHQPVLGRERHRGFAVAGRVRPHQLEHAVLRPQPGDVIGALGEPFCGLRRRAADRERLRLVREAREEAGEIGCGRAGLRQRTGGPGPRRVRQELVRARLDAVEHQIRQPRQPRAGLLETPGAGAEADRLRTMNPEERGVRLGLEHRQRLGERRCIVLSADERGGAHKLHDGPLLRVGPRRQDDAPRRLGGDDRADLDAGRNRLQCRDEPFGRIGQPRRAIDDQHQRGIGARRARCDLLHDQLVVAEAGREAAGRRIARNRDRLARAGEGAIVDRAGDAEQPVVDAARRQPRRRSRQRLLAFDPHAMAHVGRKREVAIDQRRQHQPCLGRTGQLERRGDADLELDGAAAGGNRECLRQHAIGALGGDEQRIALLAPLLHGDPLIGRAHLAPSAVGRFALLAADPQGGARHHAARRQRELQADLARDRFRIAELDRPFEIGDRVVAADRAVDARGDEVKPLQPSADLGAAVIVVELEVGEAGPACPSRTERAGR